MSEIFEVTVSGARILGERFGHGPAVVFLHAGVADRRMWQAQMSALNGEHDVIAYDARGFGETIAADEPFSRSEDLLAVLDQLEIASATLVGCSLGGRTAIDFALAWPQRVDRLALLAPAISGAPTPSEFPPAVSKLINDLEQAERDGDMARVNAIEANIWLDGPESPEGRVSGTVRELFLDMNGLALQIPELDHESAYKPAYDELADLAAPTLVIWGELDFAHVKAQCQKVVHDVDGAVGEEIPETAHLLNLEKPELTASLLRNFLSRN